MTGSPRASLQDLVRMRGLFTPTFISQDFTVLTGAALLTAATYVAVTKRRPTSTKDKVVLASGTGIFWYAGRYLFYGVRWGATSSIWLMDKVWPISSSSQWSPCPYDDPTRCDLYSVPVAQAPQILDKINHAQANNLHFTPVLHVIKTFVDQHPLILTTHLVFITVAGLLWPLQVWGTFRQENYGRHKVIGKVVMACMLGTYATASVITAGHLGSEDWAEKATGLGFALAISFSLYNLIMGVVAAKKKDIPAHRRHVARMIGVAYGVFPFKYLWLVLLGMTNVLTGQWAYAASIWLSSITGVVVSDWAFSSGALPAEDATKAKELQAPTSNMLSGKSE
ncbi:hypothetical protein ABBQ38_003875 [Trebouxia sp. C0009 RCD-2024]